MNKTKPLTEKQIRKIIREELAKVVPVPYPYPVYPPQPVQPTPSPLPPWSPRYVSSIICCQSK